MPEFSRVVTVKGAFDKRHKDPEKNYGVHGMEMRFVLQGPLGAVQFVCYTNIHLEHVAREQWNRRSRFKDDTDFQLSRPMGADIGYHSPSPQYDGQPEMECNLLPGGKCYYDGSTLAAEEFMPEFIEGGSDAVWPMLEDKYRSTFEETP